MDLAPLRKRVRQVIFWFTSLIIVLLLVRLVLQLFSANPNHHLTSTFYDLTLGLVTPLSGVWLGSPLQALGAAAISLLAIVIYIFVAFLLSEFITSVLDDDPLNILVNFLDALLKLGEFIFIARLVFSLFGVTGGSNAFVNSIYNLTDWSQGIFPSFNFLWGELELSTIAVIVILGLFDLFLEGTVQSWREARKKRQRVVTKETHVQHAPPPQTPASSSNPQSGPQNITINVGQQQPQPQPPQQRKGLPRPRG